MTDIKKYSLVHIKRAFCNFACNTFLAGAVLTVYMTGMHFELYSNQYETLVFLALASVVVLPMFDYLLLSFFNRYQYEYVALSGDKIKIRSNVIFKNSGTEEKVIDKDRVELVSLQYKYLPCLERILVRYDGSCTILYKKDFKAQEFETIYTELKTGA